MNSIPLLFLLLTIHLCEISCQHNPNTYPGRSLVVHLFEWRWDDISEECRTYLGPNGFAAIQISPPSEHILIDSPEYQPELQRPWWENYQPVSYHLNTRAGNESDFQTMIRTCNQAGIRVYVDVVLNHMTNDYEGSGFGTGGSYYDGNGLNYNGVPYDSSHFNGPDQCPTETGSIQDITDVIQLRNCKMGGLNDLNQKSEYVRQTIAEFLNRNIAYGVAGFRIDAAKHMWPEDLENITSRLMDLPEEFGFQPRSKPLIYSEVIDFGIDPIRVDEYFNLGRVTEFKYGKFISQAFKGQYNLSSLYNFGEQWGMMNSNYALAFIDNHDNQRGHGVYNDVLTFRTPKLYKMAVSFMLAWPYGLTRVISSYDWEQHFINNTDINDWVGPPHDEEFNINHVTINPDGSCSDFWICEHRWPQFRRMVQLQNYVEGTDVNNWWDNSANQIMFGRGNKAFIILNNENTTLTGSFQTNMIPGQYCDVISGEMIYGTCTGKTVQVDSEQRIIITLPPEDQYGIMAITTQVVLPSTKE